MTTWTTWRRASMNHAVRVMRKLLVSSLRSSNSARFMVVILETRKCDGWDVAIIAIKYGWYTLRHTRTYALSLSPPPSRISSCIAQFARASDLVALDSLQNLTNIAFKSREPFNLRWPSVSHTLVVCGFTHPRFVRNYRSSQTKWYGKRAHSFVNRLQHMYVHERCIRDVAIANPPNKNLGKFKLVSKDTKSFNAHYNPFYLQRIKKLSV